MNSDHTPGSPIWMQCGFCNRNTKSAIAAHDGRDSGVFPVCELCSVAINTIVHVFGMDVNNWDLVSVTHGDSCLEGEPGAVKDGTPLSEEVVLDEVMNILKGDEGTNNGK